MRIWFHLVAAVSLLLRGGQGQEAGPPTWPDGSILNVTQMGIGRVLLAWPRADNNVFDLIGYLVYLVPLTLPPLPLQLAFNGTGLPGIREFLISDLVPGTTYSFYIAALNINFDKTVKYESSYLFRPYTPSVPEGLDPTVLSASSFEFTAGEGLTLSITGKQPSTGFDQTIGPICSMAVIASCLPGRTFVAFIQNPCALADYDSRCRDVYEGETNWTGTPILAGPGPTFAGADPLNNGKYILDVNGNKAGTLALSVQAITSGQILGLYWDNERFYGLPVDVHTDPAVNFEWGTGPIIQWVPELVSVRWTGYLKPETSGTYIIACLASTYCDVWIDDVLVIDSISPQTSCEDTCVADAPLMLQRAHFHKLRVDYVTLTGTSFAKLLWTDTPDEANLVPIPSAIYQRGALIKNSPFPLTVKPARIAGSGSYVYGSDGALTNPMVGKRYTLFVQAGDRWGNACTDYDDTDTVSVTVQSLDAVPTVYQLEAAPYDLSVSDCVYAFQFAHSTPGNVSLSVMVNSESASNSPIFQSVSPGLASLPVSGESAGVVPPTPNVTEPFSVAVPLFDAYGYPANMPLLPHFLVTYRLYPDATAPYTACSQQSPFTWLVSCWDGSFTFIDDSQLVRQDFPSTFTDTINDFVNYTSGTLFVPALQTPYAGPHSVEVRVGDEVIGPVSLNISAAYSPVNASMCLVQFRQPPTSAVAVVNETLVTARVLLRDLVGNVLTDRATSVLVELVFAVGNGEQRLACAHVEGKYVECAGYPMMAGTNTISVEVDGQQASMTVGTAPSSPACVNAPVCGTPRCPCLQQRIPASTTLEVDAY